MKLSGLAEQLEQMVPSCFAESDDHVGLMCGDANQEVRRILVAVDLTAAVLAEAKRRRAEMILTHHPPIRQKIGRIVNGKNQTGLVYQAIRRGVALYAMHTNLDAIEGGTNSILAEVLGISGGVRPLRLTPGGGTCKLVVFVPAEAAGALSEAIFAAGAGRIGHQHRYRECSFASGGVGSFHGDESTSPAVGRAGRREYVQELRLETIVPVGDLPAVLTALRTAHPYEEPAYDVIPLEPLDDRVGLGRVGRLARPVTVAALLRRVKKALKIKNLQLLGRADRKVTIAAVASGSLGDLLPEVISSKAQFLLTGEMNHHRALEAAQNDLTVAIVGHWTSERPGVVRLAEQVRAALPQTAVMLSASEAEPLVAG